MQLIPIERREPGMCKSTFLNDIQKVDQHWLNSKPKRPNYLIVSAGKILIFLIYDSYCSLGKGEGKRGVCSFVLLFKLFDLPLTVRQSARTKSTRKSNICWHKHLRLNVFPALERLLSLLTLTKLKMLVEGYSLACGKAQRTFFCWLSPVKSNTELTDELPKSRVTKMYVWDLNEKD